MRPLLVLLVFALSAAVSGWAGVQALEARENEAHPRLGLDAWAEIAPRIETLDAAGNHPGGERIVFLGDSTTLFPIGGAIPQALARTLAKRERSDAEVHSLGFSGMNPFDYYYLSEPIGRTHADRVVMNVNLAVFSRPARAYLSRPELAGWIPPRRWAEAALLPLQWQGLTFDELILRSTIVELGAWKLWYALARHGVRLEKAYQDLSLRAQRREQSFRGPFTKRMLWLLAENGKLTTPQGPKALRERYGPALAGIPPDHPVLRLLGAAVGELVSAGIPVTVYVGPIDVNRVEDAGLANPRGLATTLESVRGTVESAGGHFLDLHDLLPSRAFRDPTGHLTNDGPHRVARVLARAIERDARAREPSSRGLRP